MEENIRIQLVEMNRLIKYDRSKTLLEQTSDYDLSNIVNQQQGYQDRFANNRYNPIKNDIDRLGIDDWMRMQNKSEAMRYKGKEKPTVPVVDRGEGYYLDKNGRTKYPNGYWRIMYNSPKYKEYYKYTIQPMLDLNKRDLPGQAGMPPFTLLSGKYKEDVWDIYKQDLEEWEERQPSPLSFLADWDAHDWLETAELITGLIGMIPIPPVALVGNLLSMGFGIANAELYRSEGNNYDASVALGLALIPGPEVVRLSRNMAKPGKTIVKDGAKQLTDDGAKLIDDAVRANWKSALSKSLTLAFKGNVGGFLKYMLYLYQKLPRMAKFYVTLAGFPLTMEQLYYLWTLSLTPEQQLSEREKVAKSKLKPVIDMFKRPDKFISDCTTALVNWIKGEEVELIDNIDPSMFENIEPEGTDEESLTDLEDLIKQYEEKPD
jgi:ribosomal protein L32E